MNQVDLSSPFFCFWTLNTKIPQNDINKLLSDHKSGTFENLQPDLLSEVGFFLFDVDIETWHKNSPADKNEATSHPELLKGEE